MKHKKFANHDWKGATTVNAVTLREAARRLGIDGQTGYVKGIAEGMGVALFPVGRALCMSEQGFAKLKARFADRTDEIASA